LKELKFSNETVLIDRYKIERFHLAGGMQEVYLCFDQALNRHVVVKTPKAGIKDRRFKRGAEMGARINHPNVAATFDYFENNTLTFMVEEYIPGLDLGKRLETDFHFMDPSLAAHVIHHIARALHEAHRVGICHRDLKPSNIMTSADASLNIIKLTDFGIAKLAENEIAVEMELFEKDDSTLTSSNTLLGAVPYLAPECWDDWKAAGQPMDIWALGCISYQLLTGAPPFGTGKQAIGNVIKAQQKGQVTLSKPAWFGKHVNTATIENELWKIILSCLQVEPTSRPTAADLVSTCNSLCYATTPRRIGTINRFGVPYANGSQSNTGNIQDTETGDTWFFHGSEFFGVSLPEAGQRVSFSIYPGVPHWRSAPILLLR